MKLTVIPNHLDEYKELEYSTKLNKRSLKIQETLLLIIQLAELTNNDAFDIVPYQNSNNILVAGFCVKRIDGLYDHDYYKLTYTRGAFAKAFLFTDEDVQPKLSLLEKTELANIKLEIDNNKGFLFDMKGSTIITKQGDLRSAVETKIKSLEELYSEIAIKYDKWLPYHKRYKL